MPEAPEDRRAGRIGRRVGAVAAMASLIALGAYLHVPLGAAPISLQTLFVLLAGFLLGPVSGAFAATLYLFAGAFGLPVFAGGASGVQTLLGATGGFLLSFPAMAAVAGMAGKEPGARTGWTRGLLWGAAASALTFVVGVTWLEWRLDLGWRQAAQVGVLPFLPGAAVKLFLAIAIARPIQSRRSSQSS